MTWLNNVVGGIGAPRVYKLEDNNRVTNGSFEDVLSDWNAQIGAGVSRILASSINAVAPRGDYILEVVDNQASSGEVAYQDVDHTEALENKSFLLMFKVRGLTDHDVLVNLGSAAVKAGVINNVVALTVPAKSTHWRMCYAVITFSSETDQYIRIELDGATASSQGTAYYDDVRLYEIEDTYNFEQPNKWKQDWVEDKIADFNLMDGKNRKILNGWRYMLNMIYEYNSAEDQAQIVEITENGICFVIPHIDSLFGCIMRWNGSYKNDYFFDKYLGHTVVLALKAVELEKDKPREIGTDFTVA